jgi:hypothetical protein
VKSPETSLRVGVVGRAPLAALWAVVLRDFGRHRVIGYALDPHGLRDAEAVKLWDRHPIASAPQMRLVVEHADIIFVFGVQRWWSILNLAAAYHSKNHPVPTLVVARWMPARLFQVLALAPERATPVVYSPLVPTDSIEELTDPTHVWACSADRSAQDQIERVWRPINNKTLIARVGLPRASETGLAWSPVEYAISVGVLTPRAVEALSERSRDPR